MRCVWFPGVRRCGAGSSGLPRPDSRPSLNYRPPLLCSNIGNTILTVVFRVLLEDSREHLLVLDRATICPQRAEFDQRVLAAWRQVNLIASWGGRSLARRRNRRPTPLRRCTVTVAGSIRHASLPWLGFRLLFLE